MSHSTPSVKRGSDLIVVRLIIVVAPYEIMTMSLQPFMLADGAVRFFVHPAGQLDESTQPLDLREGERIGLVIPPRGKAGS
jgi:hypothetical protein